MHLFCVVLKLAFGFCNSSPCHWEISGGKFNICSRNHVAMSSHDSPDSPAVYFKFKMASNEKWEVVGKGGKKRTPNEGKKNRVKASDMPKAEIVSE